MPGLHHSSTRGEILELVRRGQAATRAELTRLTGLSRSAVAETVATLLAEGLLTEHHGARPTGRGRPSLLLRAGLGSGWVGAVDLGHAHVAVVLGDLSHRLVHERRVEFPVDDDARAALRQARAMLVEAMHHDGVGWGDLHAVGVALPFPVVGPRPAVAPLGDVPGWQGAHPRELLQLPPSTRVVVGNDANLGAWGEFVRCGEPPVRSLLYAKAGDGFGAGLIVGGEVFGGAHGVGGEIGHVRVAESVTCCRCGRRGCLDALVTAAARAGADAGLARIAGTAVGRVIAGLTSFVDPDVVVLGGELGARDEVFVAAVRAAYGAHAAPSRTTRLRTARLGVRAELEGAYDRAVQQVWARIRPGDGRITAVH